jgi:hypothetical protein
VAPVLADSPRGDDRIGLKTSSIDEHRICAFETPHFGDDGGVSALQCFDEAIVDGWVDTA